MDDDIRTVSVNTTRRESETKDVISHQLIINQDQLNLQMSELKIQKGSKLGNVTVVSRPSHSLLDRASVTKLINTENTI